MDFERKCRGVTIADVRVGMADSRRSLESG